MGVFYRILLKGLLLFLWCSVVLFGGPDFFSDDYIKQQKLITPKEIDWKNFTNYGFYRLDDIVEADKDKDAKKTIDFNYPTILRELIKQKNVAVIDAMKVKLDDKYKKSKDYELLSKELLRVLDKKDANREVGAIGNIEKKSIATSLGTSGMVLQRSDVMQYFENKVGDRIEKMILLRGGVEVAVESMLIKANNVLINLDKQEIYGEDELSIAQKDDFLEGKSMFYNYKDQKGYILNPRGLIGDRYFKGRLMTINNKDYFTLYESSLSFSENTDPYYSIYTDVFDHFGEEKWTGENLQVRVGNHPFLWVPFYISYPLTTGIKLLFGENRREGFYLLSTVDFLDTPIDKITLRFDVYEKLGLYSSVENTKNFDWIKYSFLLGLAAYTDNFLVRDKPEKLTYTHNNSPYINSRSYFRHKLKYDQTIYLHKGEYLLGVKKGTAEKSNISMSLESSIFNVSDPFITDNYRNKFSHFDWGKITERHDRDETPYKGVVSDKNKYSLVYNLAAPSVSFSTAVKWNYDVYKNPDKDEKDPIDEQYKMYLKFIDLPIVNFRHSGIIDKRKTGKGINRPFYLDLGYSFSLNYSGKDSYKNGKKKEKETGILKNIEPYSFVKKNTKLNLGVEILRKFEFSPQESATAIVPLEWFYWDIEPLFSMGYINTLVPIDFTTSNDYKKNRGDLFFKFSLATKLGFFSLMEFPLEIVLTESIVLKDSRNFFFIPVDVDKKRLGLKEYQVSVSYDFSSKLQFFIPSTRLKAKWSKSYTYLSMLPTSSLTLGYKQSLFTNSDLSVKKDFSRYKFDRFSSREIFSDLVFEQKGYGLFYLSYLDYILNSSINFRYDLNPEAFKKNIENKDISTNFLSDIEEFWKDKRIKNFDGTTSFSLIYYFATIKESLFYRFFHVERKILKSDLTNNKLDFLLEYKRDKVMKLNPWFDVAKVSFIYTWDYYFLENDYTKDKMSFTFVTGFDIFKDFNLETSFKVSNARPYLYFRKKVDFLKLEHVPFFTDVKNSMGFAGMKGKQEGLFKFDEFRVSIFHNIDDWFLRFSYVLDSESFNEKSFRGYYFDHKLEFEVNLKPEKDPRGKDSTPFFQKLNKNFSPRFTNTNK